MKSDSYARIAIVTGATSGIGEATARKFVASGFGVVGGGRNAAKLAALEQELGFGFCGVAGDAADNDVLAAFFSMASEHFGKAADIVVVNAGRGLGGSVRDAEPAQFNEILRINVSGAFALMQQAARKMVANQQGSFPKSAADIVVVGSVVGRHTSPFSAAYGATKHAVHALAEGLRRDVGPKGVRVSLVEPGIVLSGFQAAADYSDEMVETFKSKFGPLPEVGDVADAICFIVAQPPHVHISDIVVRPTRQDYP